MPGLSKLTVFRFVLRAISPLTISSGAGDPLQDNLLVRDCNGLPMIPATTLAGAVRANFDDESTANRVFGFQDDSEGGRSLLTFSDGLCHCSDGTPRDGWSMLPDGEVDRLLLRDSPMLRQHVALNERGVTDDSRKFARSAVPPGARFTFEISSWEALDELNEVANMVRLGLFLGGATRSGYGALKCELEGKQDFDLTTSSGSTAYRRYAKTTLGAEFGCKLVPVQEPSAPKSGWTISGTIEGPLLIGDEKDDGRGGRQPYAMDCIEWANGRGKIGPRKELVPAASVKGALRHRTLFHLRRLGEAKAGDMVDDLFGCAAQGERGRAGKLRFVDAELQGGDRLEVAHVSLDRFTGGARDKSGALFSDFVVWRPDLQIEIFCSDELTGRQYEAFGLALSDLKTGLLGIGADWGEGSGLFETCNVIETNAARSQNAA